MNVINPSFRWLSDAPNGAEMLDNITRAGRICYQSEKTGDSAEFVRRLIKRGHESVLEHEKISVVIICDRGVTHELVRHRIASYSQESTRYCNYDSERFDGQIKYIDLKEGALLCPMTSELNELTLNLILYEWVRACADAEDHYKRMIALGASPQIARSVLNNSTKTEIAVTMNLREWRHFFKLRCAPAAHPQMRQIANVLLHAFKDAVPVVFDDLEG